ncbi:alanine racemase [Sphingomonas bacterium]|uniref:alanine racemase n=1 Tax=Sphingomonas bacterium TaxID=1895847 RepID=UPI00261F583D|nr:alanine racemase [Sphingomonas bacterium]MDB5679733.1 alanine racemase [Sphingomonas bacterium]
MTSAPLRLRRDADALTANWRALARMSGGAACGAAVKADGYGLGATWVATTLAAAGCRDFFVATWAEAEALAPLDLPALSVLHGVRDEDVAAALSGVATPVISTAAQAARWRAAGGGACHVMLDTGMNRLGLGTDDLAGGALEGLAIDTLMSHLASADEDSPKNDDQRRRFVAMADGVVAKRLSLANSAGIALGADFAFDLTRPGLALYGGVPRPDLAGAIVQVAFPLAQVLQRRTVAAGETVGYNATWTASADTEVAILNIGYADGYWRGFSGHGRALHDGAALPLLGRVSMDLIAVDVTAHDVAEGDWLDVDYNLPRAAAQSGMSQYELLTGLGGRFDRLS